VMAMCPEDVFLTIENEIVFQGRRRSVIIDIKSETKTQFSVETILYGNGVRDDSPCIVSIERGRKLLHSPVTLKWDGGLSDALDLALINAGARSTIELRIACVELISAIIFSVSGPDLYRWRRRGQDYSLPKSGFKALLGSNAVGRVRDTLLRIFTCEPSYRDLGCDQAYDDLCVKLADAVPSSLCKCNKCFANVVTCKYRRERCTKEAAELWTAIHVIVTRGVLACFVTADENACIRLSCSCATYMTVLRSIPLTCSDCNPRCLSAPNRSFGTVEFHAYILDIVSKSSGPKRTLGVSLGACSIFAATIQNPLFQCPQDQMYVLADGQFHDEHNSYEFVAAKQCLDRRKLAVESITRPLIVPSSLGVNSLVAITARGIGNGLTIRTVVQMSTKTLSLDLYKQHIAYLGVNIAVTCGHNTRNCLSDGPVPVITTSVVAPAVFRLSDLQRWRLHERSARRRVKDETQPGIGMVLTHKSPEAQFLACVPDTPTLFQGDSCLDCAVEHADKSGFELIIQS
jgi:hypothetical protein